VVYCSGGCQWAECGGVGELGVCQGGVDCGAYRIKSCSEGGRNSANAVYNEFFQKHNQHPSACDFSGTGRITNQNPFDPKHPRCVLLGRPSASAYA